jgi:alpha-mannosidase
MTTHIVSHTHWDREWYLTFEQFRLRLVGLIDRLLDLMESQPEYRFFHLDGQTIVLEDYLELRPHQESRLRTLIAEGRILIGPWYDMPDEFLVSGESLVRNLQLGHRISRRFGTPMPVGYLPDLFGHVGQMPQILRNFNLDNAILWRGFGGPRVEYWWHAPDGSRVLMMHLPSEGYCNATRVHLDPAQMVQRTTRAIEAERARTAVGEVLLMNGVDHVEPHPVIPRLADELTQTLGTPVRHSTLPAYVDAVRRAVNSNGIASSLEVIAGELRGGEDYANLLPGVFSARVYLKQANARVQTLLERRAEPLAVFAALSGAPYPDGELRYAWKTLLQNHPHDSICGCSIDAVHDENMTRFARARQVAEAVAADSAMVVARSVPAPGAGSVRVVAINTTGVDFRGIMQASIDVAYESDEPRRQIDSQALDSPVTFWPADAAVAGVIDSDGHDVPYQVLHQEDSRPLVMSRYETPWILRARRHTLVWMAAVPACGYVAFDVRLQAPATRHEAAAAAAPDAHAAAVAITGRTAQNEFVALSINDDGTVDVTDRRTNVVYRRCGEFEDVADAGDEYNYSPPPQDRQITSADATDVRVTPMRIGPLRTSFEILLTLRLPASLTADRSRRSDDLVDVPVRNVVTLDAGSARVVWEVSIENGARDHRLRMLFPTGVDAVTHVRAETAFGVATRPAQRDRPAHVRMEVPVNYGPTGSFTEAGDDRAGAVLLSEGLVEYEAVADERGGLSKLALTLLRCVGYLSREDLVMRPSGHAGPGLATPGAQCLGTHEFRLAFEPRGKRPSNASLFDRAASFVAAPLAVPTTGPGGNAALHGRFIQLETGGRAVLSALHRAEESDAVVMRVFNPDADAATVAVQTAPQRLDGARTVNFLGEVREDIVVRDGTARMTVPPYGIVTAHLLMEG